MQRLPIGIQSFEALREEKYLYADKTAIIYDLVKNGKVYFLSRPRRFGKSLLCSTLRAYFEGKKELFKGLAIERLETAWTAYPVMHFDFNGEVYGSIDGLEQIMDSHLKRWENTYGCIDPSTTLSQRFYNVVCTAHEKTGKRAVVIVDEYDKPLLETFGKEDMVEQTRALFKGFFGNLKKLDEHLQFVFFTGVTKFSKISIFSDLNQLRDISLEPQFDTICGLTEEELHDCFSEHIEAMAKKNSISKGECINTLKKYYDGYHFSESMTDIYNPFSILNALASQRLGYFWFSTGTPTFLIKHLMKDLDVFDFKTLSKGVTLSTGEITDYRPENPDITPLLYQSGYLTIKKYNTRRDEFTLAYPNKEVEYGMLNSLAPNVSYVRNPKNYISAMQDALDNCDIDAMMLQLKAIYASLPYIVPHFKEGMDENDKVDKLNMYIERDFQNIIYVFFLLMGQPTYSEVQNCLGRADCIVETDDYVYIFEFKVDAPAAEALEQIKAHEYAARYAADKRKVVKVGVQFSRKKRNIVEWNVE